MRKRQTFLLTILSPEADDTSFCGRLKVISSGKTCTFTNVNELYHLIASEMGEEMLKQFSQHNLAPNRSEKPFSAD